MIIIKTVKWDPKLQKNETKEYKFPMDWKDPKNNITLLNDIRVMCETKDDQEKRIAEQNANIQRVDAQVKGVKWQNSFQKHRLNLKYFFQVLPCSALHYAGQLNAMSGTAFIIDMKDTKDGGAMTQNKIPRYNVYVEDMFLDTKQPKKHQERFIRKLLGDEAYYKRWRKKKQSK